MYVLLISHTCKSRTELHSSWILAISTKTDDRRLLIILRLQLCVRCDGCNAAHCMGLSAAVCL